MGFCTNCGSPTDRPDNICNSCASTMSQGTGQPNFTKSYDNFPVTNAGGQKSYWEVLFSNPMIAFNQIFKGATPENNFDISEYEKKFNWGAALGGFVWLAFNSNFWLAIIATIALFVGTSIISAVLCVIPFLGPLLLLLISFALFIGIVVYFGLNGNRITYKTRPYGDLENFKKNQKIWAWAMLGWLGLSFLMFIGSILSFIARLGLSFLH